MSNFDEALKRLKNALKVTSDIEVAKMLGLTYKAFASRKLRNSFPEENLKTLIRDEPWREIDFEFIMTGELSTFEQINRRFKSETGLKNDLDVVFALGIRDRDFIQGRLNNVFPIQAIYHYASNPNNKKINIDYVISGKTATVKEYGVHLIEMLEKLSTLSTEEQLNIIQQVNNLYALHKIVNETKPKSS